MMRVLTMQLTTPGVPLLARRPPERLEELRVLFRGQLQQHFVNIPFPRGSLSRFLLHPRIYPAAILA